MVPSQHPHGPDPGAADRPRQALALRFPCPRCECPGKLVLPGPGAWECPACAHRLQVEERDGDGGLPACVLCGCPDLYRKKDFPHGPGLAILSLACLISFVTYGLYEKWLTWAILIGTALFDGLLYLWVGDVVVCYRCGAQYRGLPVRREHGPHDLGTAERYRQERIRREQLRTGA
jgi:hypothetical protein